MQLESIKKKFTLGSTEIWTRIAGFRVQSANHYTIEPPSHLAYPIIKLYIENVLIYYTNANYPVNLVFPCIFTPKRKELYLKDQ